ncbi:LacI family DNA-binding transcriptional regulator [Roseivivax sp. GX 12232]|uniref:LacI family DNA-binding transcriptional regulator n=1 Tax=Roseivivax sp. GX 12232 TaxID=2900547 RepID=UPI001E4EEC8B|nr:LacI family DNA-binding transcriptional regulator [Roseivivax sp. GX 12232]MCE0505862.1 LacI family DNA-binding transcriptional regulator [Roseivivax sp. GX 12232]
MAPKTRIADVAAAAGVSTATVSRALSAPGVVGPETLKKVMAAVEATGYRVNAAARDLRRQRARSILVLAPNLANTFFSRIIAAIQEVAGQAGLAVQISDSRAGPEVLQSLGHDGRADGIILLDGALPPEVVRGWRLPVVQLCEWNDAYALPALGIDNAAAAGLAVTHLADLGHGAILHVAGPPENVLSRTREAGFLAAARARGVAARVLPGDFTMASGAQAARDWQAMADRPSAVFTASDECAFGFISECARMGIAVPSEVSVVGFDDVEFAGHFIPPLTTIHQPRAKLGRAAAERLVAALEEGVPLKSGHETIAPHLVVRGTTAAAG